MGEGFLLGEATAAERTARDRLTYDAWGARLTREQYLDRERILRQTDHGRLAMHSWVLRLQSGVVVASCETFRLPLLPTGSVEVIASVFVDGPLRGARMASRLMAALVENRREAGLDGLVLFSEVGPTLYERSGFRVLPMPARSWSAASGGVDVQPLCETDLPEAFEWRNRLRAERIDLRLSAELFDWHLTRSRFYATHLPRQLSPTLGARAGGVQAVWVPDFKCNVLRLLDLTGTPGASPEPVIAAARGEAARMGLDQVELWDDAVSQQLAGGEPLGRDDEIPMGIAFTPRGALFLGPMSRACWA